MRRTAGLVGCLLVGALLGAGVTESVHRLAKTTVTGYWVAERGQRQYILTLVQSGEGVTGTLRDSPSDIGQPINTGFVRNGACIFTLTVPGYDATRELVGSIRSANVMIVEGLHDTPVTFKRQIRLRLSGESSILLPY